MNRPVSVGVIGAGISGLTCARALQEAGCSVAVLEKSRGMGGRVATRRVEPGLAFDHGAQYFTVRDERFAAQTDRWLKQGVVQRWNARVVALEAGSQQVPDGLTERFIGAPGMNAIARDLALGLELRTGFEAGSLLQKNGEWFAVDTVGVLWGPFDWMVSSAPAPQTAALLGAWSPKLAGRASEAKMAPCWAAMVQFSERLDATFDAAFVRQSPLSWIARNGSKPGRGAHECWVLHGSGDWSAEHLEETAAAIGPDLLSAFWTATGITPQPTVRLIAHRWRYALPVAPLEESYLLDDGAQLAACGDWCNGPRVEGAYLSGLALADAILAACRSGT